MALSADGRIAMTRSRDKTARLWDAATGTPIGPHLRLAEGVMRIALCPDGRTALTSSFGNTAQLWEAATGKAARSAPSAPWPHPRPRPERRRQDCPDRQQRPYGQTVEKRCPRCRPSGAGRPLGPCYYRPGNRWPGRSARPRCRQLAGAPATLARNGRPTPRRLIPRGQPAAMPVHHANAAGIDVHSDMHMVRVPAEA